MRPEHDAQPEEGAQSVDEDGGAPSAVDGRNDGAAADSPRHSRALLALVAAGTVAVIPIAGTVIGPAGSGENAHSSPVFLLAEASHDVGHNDWAYQGGVADRVIWAVTYVVLALAWLGVTLWMRSRDRRAARTADAAELDPPTRPNRLWLKTWGAVLAIEFAAGALTIGAVLYAQWTATSLGPVVLRLADACSPWWSCVAALVVVARAERDTIALRAALAYGAVLAVLLLVPLPGPNSVKVLILAATAAVPALLGRRAEAGTATTPLRSEPLGSPLSSAPLRSDAAAAG